jgi:very-short-patch-repair endonuclease
LPNDKARALRKHLTPQEVKLWVKLRDLKALGFHFRKQAPIGHYIVDFVSFSAQIVIEVDGGQHGMADGIRSDNARDTFLQSQGFRVLRFWNSEVDQNLDGVMESILGKLKTPTPVLRTDLESELRSPRTPQGGGISRPHTPPHAARRNQALTRRKRSTRGLCGRVSAVAP